MFDDSISIYRVTLKRKGAHHQFNSKCVENVRRSLKMKFDFLEEEKAKKRQICGTQRGNYTDHIHKTLSLMIADVSVRRAGGRKQTIICD